MRDQNMRLNIHSIDMDVWILFFSIYFRHSDQMLFDFDVLNLIEDMKRQGSNQSPTIEIFNIILSGIAHNDYFDFQNVDLIHIGYMILNEVMPLYHITPNAHSYVYLIRIYAKNQEKIHLRQPNEGSQPIHILLTEWMLKIGSLCYSAAVEDYKLCLEHLAPEKYDQILKWLADSSSVWVKRAHIAKIGAVVGLMSSCRENTCTHNNNGDADLSQLSDKFFFRTMMRIYAMNAPDAAVHLWESIVVRLVPSSVIHRENLYQILLEYWSFAKYYRKSRGYIVSQFRKFEFDLFNDWLSMKSALKFAQTMDPKYQEILNQTAAQIVVGLVNLRKIHGIQPTERAMIIALIFENPKFRDWMLDESSFPSSEERDEVGRKSITWDVIKIGLNMRYGRIFQEVEEPWRAQMYFEEVLGILERQDTDYPRRIDNADWIFYEIMNFYHVKPTVKMCQSMITIYSTSSSPQTVKWSLLNDMCQSIMFHSFFAV